MNISPGVRKFSELELLVEELQTRSGRPIQLTLRGDPQQIPYRYWGIFTSQLEESLSNSVRHSQATELFVRLDVLPKHVRFEVRDNGESGVNISPGMGIESMKERAMAVGGRLILDATQGVSVTSLLPLEEES
jgi:signal transduction histidine kinase